MILFPNRKNSYVIIFFISLISIIFALYIEYVLKYQPCKLCIYQRLPYLTAIFVSFIGFNYSNNDKILIVTIMIFTLSAILSGYHFGIENNIFDELSACASGSSDILNKSKLLESLNKNMPVNCKDATFKILGISLAAINTIFSILIVIFSIRTLAYEKN
jgi:disulfide bond formation protein DsbB